MESTASRGDVGYELPCAPELLSRLGRLCSIRYCMSNGMLYVYPFPVRDEQKISRTHQSCARYDSRAHYGVRPCKTHTFGDQLGGVRGRK